MRTEDLYLLDILDACDAIDDFIAGLSKEAVLNTDIVLSAIERKFEIIGEAANLLSPDTRAEFPDVDWKSVIGFRNVLIHQYFSSSLDLIWEAASEKIGPFRARIREILDAKYPERTRGK